MKKTPGMILMALGVIGLVWVSFTYSTQEKIVDVRPIDITQNKPHSVSLPPFWGAAAVLGGIVLLVSGKQGITAI